MSTVTTRGISPPKLKRRRTMTTNTYVMNKLDDIFKLCKELKIGQEIIKNDQIKIQARLSEIENKLNKQDKVEIHKDLESLTNKVTSIRSDVQQNIHTFAEKVKMNIEQNTSQIQTISKMNRNVECLKNDIENKLANESDEKIEGKRIKQKENNICIYNIPESKEAEAKNAFQDDINKLQQTFSGKFKLDKNDVTYIRRIGKASNNSNNDKTRPIIIQFKDNKKKI